MFTGLIECLAEVIELLSEPPGVRLVILAPQVAADVKPGDSVALNGCCLTVASTDAGRIAFQAGSETLARTNLRELAAGCMVNVETSLRVGESLGGHFVTGHVDGVGIVDGRQEDGEWCTMWFRAPPAQMRQMASKGSVAVDGVSLTLVDVERERFSVALIPHTLTNTTLGRLNVGDHVNLETDVLAKYVERQIRWEHVLRTSE
jgi:riboflavin synthase